MKCSFFTGSIPDGCEQIDYSQPTGSFEIISHVVLDTSANLFHATVVDHKSSEVLPGAKFHFTQDQQVKEIISNENREAEIFENGFSGIWQLAISHVGYRCLEINDVEIGGGTDVIIKMKRP